MKCNYCGNEVPDGSLTCPSCGGAIQQPQAASQQQAPQGAPPVQQTVVVVQQGPAPVPKSRTVYVILAFFFGGLGIHNFYAGRTGCGIAQLLISLLSCGFLSGIVGIWVLIEMFVVTRDGKGVPMRGGALLLIIVLAVVWVLAMLGIAIGVAISQAGGRAHTISCVSNLKQIGLGLAQYAGDFDSRYPVQDNAAGLELLRGTGILTDHAVYVCPSTETTAGSGNEPLTDANCDYIYLGGLMPYFDGGSDCPVAFEKPGSHPENKVNVLYGSGAVNTITLPDSVQTVTDLLQYLEDQATNPKVKAFLQKKQQTIF